MPFYVRWVSCGAREPQQRGDTVGQCTSCSAGLCGDEHGSIGLRLPLGTVEQLDITLRKVRRYGSLVLRCCCRSRNATIATIAWRPSHTKATT